MKYLQNKTILAILVVAVLILAGGLMYVVSGKKNLVETSESIIVNESIVENITNSDSNQTTNQNSNPKDESLSVEKSFNTYKTAILARDGELAAMYVNNETISYYSDLLKLIKFGTKNEIQSKRLVDKFTVLSIRLRFGNEITNIKDGKSLLSFAVKKGLIGEQGVSGLKYSSVNISGDLAFVTLEVNNAISPMKFKFTKENSVWKIDLVEILPSANIAFSYAAEESGYSDDEFIFMVLESLSGIKPTEKIWEPLN